VLAGGTDADGDGYCAAAATEPDCNDGASDVHPNATEVCTPSRLNAVPVDENCDGELDDGCDWFFGEVTSVIPAGSRHTQRLSPTVSDDGLRVYFTGHGGATSTLHLAERPTLDAPFAAAVAVPLSGGTEPDRSTVRRDELEIVFGGCGRGLWRATRASRLAPFGPSEPIEGTAGLCDPFLSFDGLELFGTQGITGMGFRLHVTRRASLAEPFGPLETVVLPGDDVGGLVGPTLSADGQTLFANAATLGRLYQFERTDAGFVFVRELTELGRRTTLAIAPSGSEAFFSSSSDQPWAAGLWRARVCRDGPCDPYPAVTCPATGVRSPDGLHCYWRVAGPMTWGNAVSACGDGSHLATVHSDAERMLLPGSGWLGGYDNDPMIDLPVLPDCTVATPGCVWGWVTREPWTYDYWAPNEPNNAGAGENALEGGPSLWNDYQSGASSGAVCERESWPTW